MVGATKSIAKQAEILKPDLVIVTGILPLKKDLILTTEEIMDS